MAPTTVREYVDNIEAMSVTGVTRTGKRCGKGEGYSDIEFAILRELGHPPVAVATTVHSLSVVDDFLVQVKLHESLLFLGEERVRAHETGEVTEIGRFHP